MATLFTTSINYREENPQGEINTMPSETQPDEVLSVKEMLLRHVSGMPVSGSDVGYYSEHFMPDLRTLDLTEMEDLRDDFAQRAKDLKKAVDDRKKKEAEEASTTNVTPAAPSVQDSKDIPEK